MLFQNRQQAGQLLAEKLRHYKNNSHVIVLGLPRGGVVCAKEVAKNLEVPLDVVVTKKLGAPGNPEYAVGAVAETGEYALNEEVVRAVGISQEYLDEEVISKKEKVKRYLEEFRQGRGLGSLNLKGKVVILVDDGIATGFTILAAIKAVRAQNPKKIIVAVPVSAPDSLEKIKKVADEVICLSTPLYFAAVGQFYEEFEQTTDEEVKKILTSQ